MSRRSLAQKQSLCARLSALSTPSQTKEIYALIETYASQHCVSTTKRLGSQVLIPFSARKNGDNYTFDIDLFPDDLLDLIEQLLETE